MLATDVMRTWFATVKPDAPLLDALRLLMENNQRGLPVVDDSGLLVGIISEGDFLHRRELGVSCHAAFLLEWLVGREEGQLVRARTQALRVDAVMTRTPVCVDETATVDEVVQSGCDVAVERASGELHHEPVDRAQFVDLNGHADLLTGGGPTCLST